MGEHPGPVERSKAMPCKTGMKKEKSIANSCQNDQPADEGFFGSERDTPVDKQGADIDASREHKKSDAHGGTTGNEEQAHSSKNPKVSSTELSKTNRTPNDCCRDYGYDGGDSKHNYDDDDDLIFPMDDP